MRRLLIVLLAFLPFICGCAATIGAVAGPVASPVSAFAESDSILECIVLIPLIPILVYVGPFVGFSLGLAADLSLLIHGQYDKTIVVGIPDGPKQSLPLLCGLRPWHYLSLFAWLFGRSQEEVLNQEYHFKGRGKRPEQGST